MKRLAILLSGRGSNFEAIARNVKEGKLQAEIAVVLSNNPEAKGLETAAVLELKTLCLPSKRPWFQARPSAMSSTRMRA